MDREATTYEINQVWAHQPRFFVERRGRRTTRVGEYPTLRAAKRAACRKAIQIQDSIIRAALRRDYGGR